MFYKKINKKNKSEMLRFLKRHFRYFTANSWNINKSFAHNVKLYNLDIPEDLKDKAYEIIFDEALCSDLYMGFINPVMQAFEEKYPGYCIGTNGRTSGYLVLYNKDYPYRSIPDVDYEDMSISELRELTTLVQDFDKACDDIVSEFISVLKNCDIAEETYTVEETVKILV